MKVRKSASVHHKTVTEFSEGQHPRRRKTSKRTQSDMVTVKIDDRVVQAAKELSAGELSRIQWLPSENAAIVHNNTDWKKR